jgi:hypothetical protein
MVSRWVASTLPADPSERRPTTMCWVFWRWPGKRSSCSLSSGVAPGGSGGGGRTSPIGDGSVIGAAAAAPATSAATSATSPPTATARI